MTENLEIEYKTMVSEEKFYELLSYFPGNKSFLQINHYYSSENNKDIVFRIRDIDGKLLFTYKERKEEGRLEHELYLENGLNDVNLLNYLSSINVYPPFKELGRLYTYRTVVELEDEAEVCFDKNIYNGILDYEIEYEVKGEKGSLDNFKKILAKANIEYIESPLTKQARAINPVL